MTSQALSNQLPLLQEIKNAKYTIQQIDDALPRYETIITGAISNNLKYIIAGGTNKYLKIWNYKTNDLMKSIKFDYDVTRSCKFTDDSQFLYVGIASKLYQFSVNNLFKKICSKNMMHTNKIRGIYCITNMMILTYSDDIIIKTDVERKQQLLQIQTGFHNNGLLNAYINGLYYNRNLNVIASASFNITLWNGDNGILIIEKRVADKFLVRVELELKSLNLEYHLSNKQLTQQQLIANSGSNISLVLSQQYFLTTGDNFINVYTRDGDLVRNFEHEVSNFYYFCTTQPDSMRAVLIQGVRQLQVCKIEIDFVK